jgi:NADPH:quinone reductase-like Zn-dependent oxidoreductase
MKAVVQDRYGPPEVFRVAEVPVPALPDDRVLVRVRAASVNALDWRMARASPFLIRFGNGLLRPKNPVRGVDVAGVVESVGKNVTTWKPGDEVFGTVKGSFAEFAAAIPTNLAPKPSRLTFEQAAALPIAAFTALEALRDHGHLTTGQRVLIYGAGGGVGTFAVQIAKSIGAHVTAVTRTENLDLVRSIGADAVVDYTKEEFTERPERYDLVVDIGGNRPFRALRRLLNPTGQIVVVGGKGLGHVLKALLISRFRNQRLTVFIAKGKDEDLQVLKGLADAGQLTPVIDRRYPLAGVPDALRYAESYRTRGKVVIVVS